MKVSEIIKEFSHILETIGDIPVQIQDDGKSEAGMVVGYQTFFIVPEEYDDGWMCNLRWWPY